VSGPVQSQGTSSSLFCVMQACVLDKVQSDTKARCTPWCMASIKNHSLECAGIRCILVGFGCAGSRVSHRPLCCAAWCLQVQLLCQRACGSWPAAAGRCADQHPMQLATARCASYEAAGWGVCPATPGPSCCEGSHAGAAAAAGGLFCACRGKARGSEGGAGEARGQVCLSIIPTSCMPDTRNILSKQLRPGTSAAFFSSACLMNACRGLCNEEQHTHTHMSRHIGSIIEQSPARTDSLSLAPEYA
jgi:hypothetical protein